MNLKNEIYSESEFYGDNYIAHLENEHLRVTKTINNKKYEFYNIYINKNYARGARDANFDRGNLVRTLTRTVQIKNLKHDKVNKVQGYVLYIHRR